MPSPVSRISAQATEVNYELHTLGWKAFQNLCTTIAAEVWGQTVQGFFDSRDGGRDGAFHGSWKPSAGESFQGSFTAQCKFTAKADLQLTLTDLKDELVKARRLAARGVADNYFLFTNMRLTGANEEVIREAFLATPGVKNFAAYGADRLSQMIRESSRLRMLVPRVYGLGDLSQILDERACNQATEILSALGDDLGKFVITDAYQRSARALIEHGFVLLLGEPACGKSTIAAALAVGAIDEWGCSTFKIRNADELVAHSNPHDPKQFFWVDDAFGATQFDSASAAEWNRVFPHMNAAIRRGARVLFTSRDYIYQYARHHLKESALPLIQESQVVIQVQQLRKDEREQILYNHIHLGTQGREFKTEIKPFLPAVAANQRFSPEIARRLGNPLFTRRLFLSEDTLAHFVEQPLELLCEIVRTIDAASRSALALVFMRGGALPSPMNLSPDEERAMHLLGGSASSVREALRALTGSLLLETFEHGQYSWRFKHPTVRDAFATVIAGDRELMDTYLAGAPVSQLFSEVTCGDVGLKGAKVAVPTDKYGQFVTRLDSALKADREVLRPLHYFLASRCDREFLAYYLAQHPEFIAGLRIGSYLYAVSDVNVLVRLHALGLLPEEKRSSSAAAIRSLAVSTPDNGFLQPHIRALLTPAEFDSTLKDIREELIPHLDEIIGEWVSNYDPTADSDPTGHFDHLVSALEAYRDEVRDYPDAHNALENALSAVEAAIEEIESQAAPEPDSDDFRGQSAELASDDARSVFDDVDQ